MFRTFVSRVISLHCLRVTPFRCHDSLPGPTGTRPDDPDNECLGQRNHGSLFRQCHRIVRDAIECIVSRAPTKPSLESCLRIRTSFRLGQYAMDAITRISNQEMQLRWIRMSSSTVIPLLRIYTNSWNLLGRVVDMVVLISTQIKSGGAKALAKHDKTTHPEM
jgi:hypothetical protein